MSSEEINSGMRGRLLNIMANDLSRLNMGISSFSGACKGPIEVIVFSFIIYNETGFSGVAGIIFLVAFIPIQSELIDMLTMLDVTLIDFYDF